VCGQEIAIDENFQTPQSELEAQGWEFSAVTFSGDYIELAKKSAGGELATPTVESPSSIVIKMNNKGNTNRSAQINYYDEDLVSWLPLQTIAITQKVEDFTIEVPEGVQSTRFQIQSAGSNEIRITQIIIYGELPVSTKAEILSFTLPGQIGDENITSGEITGQITVDMPEGADLNLVPEVFILSSGATVSPDKTVSQNFATAVNYTVTAEDGITQKVWTVTVNSVKSSEKDIVAFKLTESQMGSASIDTENGLVKVKVPINEDITNIVPSTFVISGGAAISPALTAPQDFNNDVVYIITAQDESTKTWTIRTEKVDPGSVPDLDFNKVVGWAAAKGGPASPTSKPPQNVEINTTTGGAGGNIIYINPSTFGELCNILYYRINYKNYSSDPLIIVLEPGVYDGSGVTGDGAKQFSNNMLTIQEQGDISIIGKGNVQCKFGINVKRAYNIIIRNIYFWGYSDDAVNVGEEETHHVWIDHCTAGASQQSLTPSNKDAVDGTFEVKNGASYVTVSWCVTQNHWKSCLIGHSDGNGSTDTGRLKVTHYANYYNNTYSRHPRVRFGQVHVLNCMYENSGWGRETSYKPASSIGMGYGCAASNNSEVLMENNFFYDVQFPFYADRSQAEFKAIFGLSKSSTGNKPCIGLRQTGNAYDDSGLTLDLTKKGVPVAMLNDGNKSIKFDELNPESVFNPADYYDYTPMTAEQVREYVPQYAGAGVLDWSVLDPEGSGTSISNEKENNQMTVYSVNSSIVVRGIESPVQIKVYNLSGVQLYSGVADTYTTVLPIHLVKGFYIVSIDNTNTYKIVVK